MFLQKVVLSKKCMGVIVTLSPSVFNQYFSLIEPFNIIKYNVSDGRLLLMIAAIPLA